MDPVAATQARTAAAVAEVAISERAVTVGLETEAGAMVGLEQVVEGVVVAGLAEAMVAMG